MAAYLFPKGPHSRLKLYKVGVSTPENKILQNGSDFNYSVELPYTIHDVVGISLVGWSLPRDIIPSFYPTTTRLQGNNKLDFSLLNTDIAPAARVFSVQFPTRFYLYESLAEPSLDYTVALQKLMQAAVDADPVWKDRVFLGVLAQPLRSTFILVATVDPSLPANSSTTLTLLFQSGPNAAEAANLAMGFPKADVVSAPVSVALFSAQIVESPSPVRLRAVNYIDVIVEESPLRPLQRIFVEDETYVTNTYSSGGGVNDLHIDLDNPPRRLERLNIKLRYQREGDPGDFSTNPIIVPHSLTFDIVSLVDENRATPSYVQQSMTY